MEYFLFFVLLCVISVIIINSFNMLFFNKKNGLDLLSQIKIRMLRKANSVKNLKYKNNIIELEPIDKKDEKLVREAMEIIRSECKDPHFSIDRLADKLKTSKRSLQRKFKQINNTSPSKEIRKIRLDQAVALLRAGTQIKQVVMQSGFASQSYFCKCFKENIGCTPSEFLQRETSSIIHQ